MNAINHEKRITERIITGPKSPQAGKHMHNAQPPAKKYEAPHKQNNHIQGAHANEEPQSSE